MAEKEQQGTGKHPHKSSEDPRPHHEAPTTRNAGSHEQGRTEEHNRSHESRSHEHGHSEEHGSRSEEQSRAKSASAGAGGSHSGHESRSESRSGGNESSDLKEREYRDAEGNVHHHTKTYMEDHKGEKK